MLGLVLILVLMFVALTVILWGGGLSIQGNIYSEPAERLPKRAVAAAAVLTLFYAAWVFLDYKAIDPGENVIPFDTIVRFSPTDTRVLTSFTSIKSGQETVYKREIVGIGEPQYVDGNKRPWQRSDGSGLVEAIVYEENGQPVRLEPKLTADGNFLPASENFPGYFEPKGRRSMTTLGTVSSFRWGLFLGNILLNVFQFVLWFACLWLLLRFQWTHALFLTAILWAAMTWWIIPMLLGQVMRVKKGPEAPEALHMPAPPVMVGRAQV